MTTNDEGLTENNPNINNDNEIPTKKIGITIELPMFITMMAVSLSGI